MNRYFISICAAVMLAIGLSGTAQAKEVEGELIDMHCYSKGEATGEKHADCATKCMQSGIPAGVLVDGKAWTLLTNPQPLAQYAAKTIRVTGEINQQTQAIAPDKIEVKEDGQWKEIKMKDAHHD